MTAASSYIVSNEVTLKSGLVLSFRQHDDEDKPFPVMEYSTQNWADQRAAEIQEIVGSILLKPLLEIVQDYWDLYRQLAFTCVPEGPSLDPLMALFQRTCAPQTGLKILTRYLMVIAPNQQFADPESYEHIQCFFTKNENASSWMSNNYKIGDYVSAMFNHDTYWVAGVPMFGVPEPTRRILIPDLVIAAAPLYPKFYDFIVVPKTLENTENGQKRTFFPEKAERLRIITTQTENLEHTSVDTLSLEIQAVPDRYPSVMRETFKQFDAPLPEDEIEPVPKPKTFCERYCTVM
jgi:hypothetical protein